MKKLSMVLFGGNTKKQDGPLLTVADILKRKNCDVTIITDKTHLKLPTKNGKTLQEKLQLSGHNWYELEKNLSERAWRKNGTREIKKKYK